MHAVVAASPAIIASNRPIGSLREVLLEFWVFVVVVQLPEVRVIIRQKFGVMIQPNHFLLVLVVALSVVRKHTLAEVLLEAALFSAVEVPQALLALLPFKYVRLCSR